MILKYIAFHLKRNTQIILINNIYYTKQIQLELQGKILMDILNIKSSFWHYKKLKNLKIISQNQICPNSIKLLDHHFTPFREFFSKTSVFFIKLIVNTIPFYCQSRLWTYYKNLSKLHIRNIIFIWLFSSETFKNIICVSPSSSSGDWHTPIYLNSIFFFDPHTNLIKTNVLLLTASVEGFQVHFCLRYG